MKIKKEKNGYQLTKNWFEFAFENPEKVSPNHFALMFWLIELNNRLGWKEKFGLPTVPTMELLRIKSYNTYKKILFELIEWKFITLIQKAKNQYTSNIITLNTPSNGSSGALSGALSNFDTAKKEHTTKHNDIDKHINNKPTNNKHIPDSEKTKVKHEGLRNAILRFYGFSPENPAHHRRIVDLQTCINVLDFNGSLNYFKTQVSAYMTFKKLSKQEIHGFNKFLGSLKEKHEDGGWNQENWVEKVKKHQDKDKPVYTPPKNIIK